VRDPGEIGVREFFEKYGWRSLEEAPRDVDVELFVMDAHGSFYSPLHPYRLTDRGWVNSSNVDALEVAPLRWRRFRATH
jgi:hypothetical protein